MKIECPGCRLSGNIDDSTVPATGLAMTCPRCKKQFTVERSDPKAGSVAMLDSCPSCQYATFSEEKFAVCPKCGLVVAEYQRQQIAARQSQKGRAAAAAPPRQMPEQNAAPPPRLTPEQLQKEEEARRKYGLDKVPGVVEVEEKLSARHSVELPLPVLIAGWGIIIASVLLMVYGGSGVMEYTAKLKEAKAALEALEEAQSGAAMFLQYLFFPAMAIIFSAVMLVLGVQFLGMKKWSIGALQKGAWTGVGLLGLMKVTDMIFWCNRASAAASFGYYAMGLFGDSLVLLLLIAPFLALAEYLKSPLFEKSEDLFF